jgi:SAM-dependent methyltransferase
MKRSLLEALYAQVDPSLNYGREVVADLVRECGRADCVLDIGSGAGADLLRVREILPQARLVAFDFLREHLAALEAQGIECHAVDLERDAFPVPAGSVDVVIANQILEHAKDVFWIFHQIALALREGGHIVLGVPNLASLHNRLLLAAGRQPTPIRTASAHVRGFTKGDVLDFLESCFPGGFRLLAFRGSNFYPFPASIARPLARALPSLAYANFYLLAKRRPYAGEFLAFPRVMQLETNFFVG